MTADSPVTILLVDDQPSKLLSYEVILQDLGERLVKANSGTEALQQLLRHEVAVILIDVVMPDLDGFELAQMIRDHPRFRSTAIIFVSGVAMTDLDRLRGYELGAVDYVQVPIEPQLLRARVRVFCDLYRKTQQLQVLNAELEERVAARTAELASANAELERRVEQRTREREVALARMHEMQKVESLGQLTGGIAHDFNNLLTIIMSNLAALRRRVGGEPQLTTFIDGAMQGAERGASLTKRMLAFARRQELRPMDVDLGALLGGMEEMLRRTLGPQIEVAMTTPEELPPVAVDANQLELALINLAVNARDAMPEGGRLTIGVRRGTPADLAQLTLSGSEYVCITVTDTGAGMDSATLRRAREPFFTTKGVGKGTGLGLSMVDGLASQSGGAMRIDSALGQGTTVQLWLPVGKTDAGSSARSDTAVVRTARSFCVLLVDDDDLVRKSTATLLTDLGHRVVEAGSGAGALVQLQQGTRVDVVLTDFGMPEMSGAEVARQIRRTWPSLPVVIITGFIDRLTDTELAVPTLNKPFGQDELAAMLDKVVVWDRSDTVVPLGRAQSA